nr:MAG TPA: hypothetical protein [Caudoviricetes sp.]
MFIKKVVKKFCQFKRFLYFCNWNTATTLRAGTDGKYY